MTLRKGNVFSRVCLSFRLSVHRSVSMWPLPMIILVSHRSRGDYVSRHLQTCSTWISPYTAPWAQYSPLQICPNLFSLDLPCLTYLPPPPCYWQISCSHDWRSVQTCSLEDLHHTPVHIVVATETRMVGQRVVHILLECCLVHLMRTSYRFHLYILNQPTGNYYFTCRAP